MKKFFTLIIAGFVLSVINNHLIAQITTDSEDSTARKKKNDLQKRKDYIQLIKKNNSYFRVSSTKINGVKDTTDLVQILKSDEGFVVIFNQLKEQNAEADLSNGKIILDGTGKGEAIIEYPIITKTKSYAEFKSIIVFIDSLSIITTAFKDPVADYKPPVESSTLKSSICGFWSSWSTVSYGSCRLHPNCPPSVFGARLANQKRTRRCMGGQIQTESRTVFVGCNCYT